MIFDVIFSWFVTSFVLKFSISRGRLLMRSLRSCFVAVICRYISELAVVVDCFYVFLLFELVVGFVEVLGFDLGDE